MTDEIEYAQVTVVEREDYLPKCAKLYSEHYGVWGDNSPRKGKRVKLSTDRLRGWFPNEQTHLYVAKHNGTLIGYAVALRSTLAKHGTVSWVTQLVVSEAYRNRGIASHLLRHIWGLSDDYAWGLVTANPYAIRALEKATRRRCTPAAMNNNKNSSGRNRAERLLDFGSDNIGHYIARDIEYIFGKETAQINTDFPVDHSDIPDKIKFLSSDGSEWIMGELEEDWEWFGFTFRSQKPFPLSMEEIGEILKQTDKTVKSAYRRMLGNVKGGADELDKPYASLEKTSADIDFIVSECNLTSDSIVFDFGCGNGRHSLALARKNMPHISAIDYIEENIAVAKSNAEKFGVYVDYKAEDCRDFHFETKADVILCLYDVVGSFTDEHENVRIIANVYDNLKRGGTAFFSVMNGDLTLESTPEFSFNEKPNAIFDLKPSRNMEKTGEVFNPEFMLFDTDRKIYYRKEQFFLGNELPIELLVCDRRYTAGEIRNMCESVGFTVDFLRYVSSGKFDKPLSSNDAHAKEILVKCTKL